LKTKRIETFEDLGKSYDMIYSQSKFESSNYYYSFSLSFIQKDEQKGKKLLDIGCGSGALLKLAYKKGFLTYGIDISDIAIKQAKEEVPNAELVVGSAENLPWHNSYFDYVACICSIEHHLHPDKSIRGIARVLSNNGKAFIMLPNSFFVHDVLRAWLKGEGLSHGQEVERFSTAKQWRHLLESNGLTVDNVVKYNQKKEWLPEIDFKRSLRNLVINLIRPLVPFNLSKHFMFICRKNNHNEK
jgi:ubiquinone/menaquinone biosynthesis C-methylase UbiE